MITPFVDKSDKITYVTSSRGIVISAESMLLNASRSVSKDEGMIKAIKPIGPYKQGINVRDSNDFFKSTFFKISILTNHFNSKN